MANGLLTGGNNEGHDTTTTHSAVSDGTLIVRDPGQQTQLIGEIGNQVADITRTEGQISAINAGKAELAKKGITEPEKGASKEAWERYNAQLAATDGYKTALAGGAAPYVAEVIGHYSNLTMRVRSLRMRWSTPPLPPHRTRTPSPVPLALPRRKSSASSPRRCTVKRSASWMKRRNRPSRRWQPWRLDWPVGL
jgi:hypothetical protein